MKESTKAKLFPLFAALTLTLGIFLGNMAYKETKRTEYIQKLEEKVTILEYNFKLCKEYLYAKT